MKLEEVKELIDLGRSAVLRAFSGKEFNVPQYIKERYSEPKGVFITIKNYPENKLRGCMGLPLPVYPLWYGVIYSSLQAAFNDPRFKSLRPEEFDKVIWEISILSPPEEMRVPKEELPELIELGKHGLIVEFGERKGLLLPQVPIEQGWSAEEFLSYTCLKAGLPPDCWKWKETKIYRFSGKVYKEKEPFGEIIKEELTRK